MRYRSSALISVKLVLQPATSPHFETADTGYCITRCACLLCSFRWVLISPTHGGWLRLSRHVCVFMRRDRLNGHPSRAGTNWVRRNVSALMETNALRLSETDTPHRTLLITCIKTPAFDVRNSVAQLVRPANFPCPAFDLQLMGDHLCG